MTTSTHKKESPIINVGTKYTQQLITRYHKVIDDYHKFVKNEVRKSKSPKRIIKNSDSSKTLKYLNKFVGRPTLNSQPHQSKIKYEEKVKSKSSSNDKTHSKKSLKNKNCIKLN